MSEGQGLGPVPPGGLNAISMQKGKVWITTTTSSSLGRINLSPSIDARLTTLSSLYELYRFVWVKITLYPTDNATANDLTMGYLPDYPSGSAGVPASNAAVAELPFSLHMASRMIQPQFIVIPRNHMLGRNALKWFQTDQSSPSEESIQGSLYFWTGQATVVCTATIEYELEFTNPVPAAITLARNSAPKSLLGTAIDNLSTEQKVALLRRFASPPVAIGSRE